MISTCLDPYSFFEQFINYIKKDVTILIEYFLCNLSFLQFMILFMNLLQKDISVWIRSLSMIL